MKNKPQFKAVRLFPFYAFLLLFSGAGLAQNKQQDLDKTILLYDSLFWQAYNSCDLKNMEKYFATDLEFYHDKGGVNKGIAQVMETTRTNLCSNNNFRLKREAVPGSLVIFPLYKNDGIYGAILSGEHVFYIIENNNPPRLDGQARFTHLWLLENNAWKMARILSYDHRPAVIPPQKKMISLPAAILDQYAGKYNGPKTGELTIQRASDHLLLMIGDQKMELYAQSANKFFIKERDLVFEFTQAANGKIDKMIVWENGKIAEETVRQK